MTVPLPESSLHPALEQLLEVLDQLETMVLSLDHTTYGAPEPAPTRSSVTATRCPETNSGPFASQDASRIGVHVRHLLNHVALILNANGVIDYTRRRRGTPLEHIRSVALDEIQKLKRGVRLGLPSPASDDVEVVDATGPAHDIREHRYRSTRLRELHFVVSHSVHHLAIIRLLAEQAGVAVDCQVGIAASTHALNQRHSARDETTRLGRG